MQANKNQRFCGLAAQQFSGSVAEGADMEDAARVVAAITADYCRLPGKGHSGDGFDDGLRLDGKLELRGVFMRGRRVMEDGELPAKGSFE